MKLRLESVGGFAGKAGAEVTPFDLDSMEAGAAATLRQKVAAARLDQLPDDLRKGPPDPPYFEYRLHVDNGKSRTLRFHLATVPAPLRELVETLEGFRDRGLAG